MRWVAGSFVRIICYEDQMKRHMSLIGCVITILAMAAPGLGQAGCEFSIAGDWESTSPGQDGPNLYRFGSDGSVTAFSRAANGAELHKLGRATYKLQGSQTARTLEFRPERGTGIFPWGAAKMEITRVDQASFTAVSSGLSTVWVKRDPSRYFVVFAAHRGSPPHKGGPAFSMLIKTSGTGTQAETFGLFYRDDVRIIGPIPDELYRQFTSEPASAEDTLLRLEISSQAFDRAIKIMQNSQQRAREGKLLFPLESYLNIILPLKDIAESLNQCGEDFHVHKLTWLVDDEIGANVPQWELAFQYVKKLRQLNEQRHVTDAKFEQSITSRLVLPLSKN
jgi:hypothetical protein